MRVAPGLLDMVIALHAFSSDFAEFAMPTSSIRDILMGQVGTVKGDNHVDEMGSGSVQQ